MNVTKGKAPTRGISEVRLSHLRTPLTTRDYSFFPRMSSCAMPYPLSLRGVPSGTTWQSPRESGDYSTPCPLPSSATRLRGLLRRFEDSFLALTTGRVSPVLIPRCRTERL